MDIITHDTSDDETDGSQSYLLSCLRVDFDDLENCDALDKAEDMLCSSVGTNGFPPDTFINFLFERAIEKMSLSCWGLRPGANDGRGRKNHAGNNEAGCFHECSFLMGEPKDHSIGLVPCHGVASGKLEE